MHAQQKKLAWLWFGVSGSIALLLLTMTMTGRFVGDEIEQVWKSWFSLRLIPTLTVIISTFVLAEKIDIRSNPAAVNGNFGICFWLSFVYLLLLMGLILTIPFDPVKPVDWLNKYNPIALIFDGLLAGGLGYFFYADITKDIIKNKLSGAA